MRVRVRVQDAIVVGPVSDKTRFKQGTPEPLVAGRTVTRLGLFVTILLEFW